MSRPGRMKFKDGQRSLLPDVPTVRYCRRCGRLLLGERARVRGIGRDCERRERAAADHVAAGTRDEVLQLHQLSELAREWKIELAKGMKRSELIAEILDCGEVCSQESRPLPAPKCLHGPKAVSLH